MAKKKRKKQKKRKNDNSKLVLFFIGTIVLLSSLLYFLGQQEEPRYEYEEHLNYTDINVPAITEPTGSSPLSEEKPAIGSSLPKLAIIIDDIGFNKRYRDLIDISAPITLAIIPFTPYAEEAALRGNKAGSEIILHLPMEPKGYPKSNPGRGALLVSMDKGTLLKQIDENLRAIPNIKGVNNHMGSRFTESEEGMRLVLQEVKKRGLFFIDSKTSFNSKGYSTAKELKIDTAERSVFLDNVQTEEAILKQLLEAVRIAKTKGEAVAIGHPYVETISVLSKKAPALNDEGVKLVLASEMVR